MRQRRPAKRGISPRPETFSETSTDRFHEERVRMVYKKGFEDINVDGSSNLEKRGVFSNGFVNKRIRKCRWRRMWKGPSSL
jgi:hypothetical protein